MRQPSSTTSASFLITCLEPINVTVRLVVWCVLSIRNKYVVQPYSQSLPVSDDRLCPVPPQLLIYQNGASERTIELALQGGEFQALHHTT